MARLLSRRADRLLPDAGVACHTTARRLLRQCEHEDRVAAAGWALLTGRGYNSNYRIYQSTDYVAIQIEMHHDTRLIPIGDAAPSQAGPPSAMGCSRGPWEGDTLVVETTNLSRPGQRLDA